MTILADSVINPTLDSLTAIIAAFFFYCLARPQTVKRRRQYWMTFASLLAIALCYSLRLMFFNSVGGQVVTGIVIGLLQALGMVLTVQYVGGLSVLDVADGMKDAVNDLRTREKKPAVVPLASDKPAATAEVAKPRVPESRPSPEVWPSPAEPAQPQPRVVIELPKKDGGSGAIPLE